MILNSILLFCYLLRHQMLIFYSEQISQSISGSAKSMPSFCITVLSDSFDGAMNLTLNYLTVL